jgi:hypothetical protein
MDVACPRTWLRILRVKKLIESRRRERVPKRTQKWHFEREDVGFEGKEG